MRAGMMLGLKVQGRVFYGSGDDEADIETVGEPSTPAPVVRKSRAFGHRGGSRRV
jgi:hypothetical protein